MKVLKNYSSYRIINGIMSNIGLVCVKHSNISINGRNHGCSGFWRNKNTDKVVYINSDMIAAPYGNVLIRSAENSNDFHGGNNNYAKSYESLAKLAMELTK